MEEILDYDEALLHKSFYLVDYGVVDRDSFYDLIQDEEVRELIMSQIKRSTNPHNALAYYVNNVVSIDGSPKRVGSFACDISYWVTNDTKQDLSELIGFIINEMRYFDFVDENDEFCEVSDEVVKRKKELFMNRLEMWFGCIMKDGRGLPRKRWID